MLHFHPGGDYQPPPGHPKHSEAELALIRADAAAGVERLPPSKASVACYYAFICGLCYSALSDQPRARWYFSLVPSLIEKKSDKPLDLFAKRQSALLLARPLSPDEALIELGALLSHWNAPSQMPEAQLRSMLRLVDEAEARAAARLSVEQRATAALTRADMLRGLGEYQTALAHVDAFLRLAPAIAASPKAKADGTLAIGLYMHAFLMMQLGQVQTAAASLKKAQAISGYGQATLHTRTMRSRRITPLPCTHATGSPQLIHSRPLFFSPCLCFASLRFV